MTDRLRERLTAFNIRPRRQLGQNFLHDPHALARIAAAVARDDPERIVEIGPGPGTLTDHLAELGKPLLAIEKDEALVGLLRAHFANAAHVEIRAGDFLAHRFEPVPPGPRPSVVGNIPYNISSPILLHLLQQRDAIGPATLMLQAELAERLRAPVGSRQSGSFTVLLALLARVERVLSLAPGAFFPPPKVRSEVIRVVWRPEPAVPIHDLAGFERTVRTGFGQRRKTLRNALSSRWPRHVVAAAAERAGVDPGRRGETLALDEWSRLASSLDVFMGGRGEAP